MQYFEYGFGSAKTKSLTKHEKYEKISRRVCTWTIEQGGATMAKFLGAFQGTELVLENYSIIKRAIAWKKGKRVGEIKGVVLVLQPSEGEPIEVFLRGKNNTEPSLYEAGWYADRYHIREGTIRARVGMKVLYGTFNVRDKQKRIVALIVTNPDLAVPLPENRGHQFID